MKYAIAGAQRVEASAGGRGMCPVCKGEVIAKCGTHRVFHWAHRGARDCDTWAEKETDWHRAWKNKFPAECQEFIQHDGQSGERHIADVRAPHGLVLEFQHSHLDPKERAARESFHGNMVWVVDGTRLQRDYPRFSREMRDHRPRIIEGYFLLAFPDECFPEMWLDSSVPVILDFLGVNERQPPDELRSPLWCLLPQRADGNAVVAIISREQFVDVALSRPRLLDADEIVAFFAQRIREQRAAEDAGAARQFAGMRDRRGPWRRL